MGQPEASAKNYDGAAIIPRERHHIRDEDISWQARKVLTELQQAGYEAFLVGGGVRDLLLHQHPKDFDIATSAKPEQVKKVFRNSRLIGRRFRLAHIYFGRDLIEVATFRSDHRDQNGAHTEHHSGRILSDNVYGTLNQDAFRRDFTINALYYNPADGNIIDFTGGMADLEKRQLCIIGDPEERYREDPVRMLRALRLAAKLDLSIASETDEPIKRLQPLLQGMSNARLFEEYQKLFLCGASLKTFHILYDYGFFQRLFPATNECLNNALAERTEKLLRQTLINTDDRIAEKKPVNPAFLLASMLWYPWQERLEVLGKTLSPGLARETAAQEILAEQATIISIPKRFAGVIQDIWNLQYRLHRRLNGGAQQLLSHPKFRAGYDFLLLRGNVGEPVQALAEWWTQYQEQSDEARASMLRNLQRQQRKKRKPRPQKLRSDET